MNIEQILRVDKHFSNSLLESCGLFGMNASLLGQSFALNANQAKSTPFSTQSESCNPLSSISTSSLAIAPFSVSANSSIASTNSANQLSGNTAKANKPFELISNDDLNASSAFLDTLLFKSNAEQAKLNKMALDLSRMPNTALHSTGSDNTHNPHHQQRPSLSNSDSFSMLAASLQQQLLTATQMNAIKMPISNNNSFSFPSFLSNNKIDTNFVSSLESSLRSSSTSKANNRLSSASSVSSSLKPTTSSRVVDEGSQPQSPASVSSVGWDCIAVNHDTNANEFVSNCVTISPSTLNDFNKQVFKEYQEWALRTYGDAAKTKTVTKKKYERIVNILNGQESQCLENSKFRFWVKSKGFRLCRKEPSVESLTNLSPEVNADEFTNPNHESFESGEQDFEEEVLYVPCPKTSSNPSRGKSNMIYKKVAVVENFFQIIYTVHVEMEGKAGKHAGQKRTYKAVAEMYAFLPREAVTRFLMSCKDCQKRMHLQVHANGTQKKMLDMSATLKELNDRSLKKNLSANKSKETDSDDFENQSNTTNSFQNPIDCNLKSNLILANNLLPTIGSSFKEETLSVNSINPNEASLFEQQNRLAMALTNPNSSVFSSLADFHSLLHSNGINSDFLNANTCSQTRQRECEEEESESSVMDEIESEVEEEEEEEEEEETGEEEELVSLTSELSPTNETEIDRKTKKRSNDLSDKSSSSFKKVKGENDKSGLEINNNNEEFVLNGNHMNETNKEDEEEDDDEDNGDRTGDENVDSERVKAFNMFVRLLIDENLDRTVPISKQPKEKIAAVLDSCNRQFPDLQSRSRKRIRTYLKSCRRTKKIQSLKKCDKGSEPDSNDSPNLPSTSGFLMPDSLATLNASSTSTSSLSSSSSSSQSSTVEVCLQLNRSSLNSPAYHLNSPTAERILADALDNEIVQLKQIANKIKSNLSTSVEDSKQILHNLEKLRSINASNIQSNNILLNKLLGEDSKSSLNESNIDLFKMNNSLTNSSLENLRAAFDSVNGTTSSLLLAPTSAASLDETWMNSSIAHSFSSNNSFSSLLYSNPLASNGLVQSLSTSSVVDLPSAVQSFAQSVAQSLLPFTPTGFNSLAPFLKAKEQLLSNILKNNLTSNELLAIRQLITGYRESAAFLIKSATELESLLQNKNSTLLNTN